ncbi:MAG TPA: ACT domain-containing protein, partial [Solirubrobacteraceae bacterium]
TGSSEALMRVIGVVRRRGGEVVALQYHVGDVARRSTPAMLEIAVVIDCRQASTLTLRLAGLIDVVAVRER